MLKIFYEQILSPSLKMQSRLSGIQNAGPRALPSIRLVPSLQTCHLSSRAIKLNAAGKGLSVSFRGPLGKPGGFGMQTFHVHFGFWIAESA